MEFIPTNIPDVILIKPKVFEDARGFFLETYRKSHYKEQGINVDFVQDNMSASQKGVVRGLHYQIRDQQAKLLMVPKGKILDVAVDLRKGSPTFGEHVSAILSGKNKHQLCIPTGFAHGYAVLEDNTLVSYKCSSYYNPDAERGLFWNDPELGIDWQVTDPIVSEKDQQQPKLSEISNQDLFEYTS
ncbi:dTDP-4-dehydrorhamnose 3,5-epimerase [Aliifodinibius sp. S!AR15-10]|uniref:dTDP-4-dehydrorhamnose 3,5-epimerase n=1 Tax=Aliifodinibius sp. S!AR15-10 TaxID=2950437 RepID=UPI0028623CDA|nr:dTDP-4-dehydrorhamnose 3,5-epimerase [Aliifodinibius sp. S!AR15-10]MDR8390847.1 dTDP-4-dehydrorhamnose 3,5-epimerase [Aliifodinibius sp. S!AR15-10]